MTPTSAGRILRGLFRPPAFLIVTLLLMMPGESFAASSKASARAPAGIGSGRRDSSRRQEPPSGQLKKPVVIRSTLPSALAAEGDFGRDAVPGAARLLPMNLKGEMIPTIDRTPTHRAEHRPPIPRTMELSHPLDGNADPWIDDRGLLSAFEPPLANPIPAGPMRVPPLSSFDGDVGSDRADFQEDACTSPAGECAW